MDKLQQLTEKLYAEGLAKGREEGAKVLADARAEADKIVSDARKEAQAILEKARAEADDYNSKVRSDLKMAAAQSFQATKKDIESLVITKAAGEPVKAALKSEEFLKEVILAVAQKFSAEQACDLTLVLPASLQDSLEPFVAGELAKAVGSGVEARFSKKINGGFTIAPKDGGYFISLTDETFGDLISEYLRPVTKKLLFG